MGEQKRFKTAIVGCGRISNVHISALKALACVDIVAVADLDERLAGRRAAENGIANAFTDMEAMMKETRPDVVHVLTPPGSHLRLIKIAAEHKAHVYCEKPLASTAADAREISALARESGISVCPGHSLLFEPPFEEACRRVQAGEIGRIISIRAEQGFTYEAAARGAVIPWSYTYDWGIFDNIMPHPLYLVAQFIKNPGALKVFGFNLGRVHEAEVEEFRVLIPSDGVVGEVALSLCNSPEVNQVEIVGTQGRIAVDFISRTVLCSRPTGLPGAVDRFTANFRTAWSLTKAGTAVILGIGTGRIKRNMGIRGLVHKFYKALQLDREPPVKLEDGVLVVRLMDEIRTACQGVVKQRVRAGEAVDSSINPRVLVTGATGFLGGHLVKRLSDCGVAVRATTRLWSRATGLPHVQWVRCDVGNPDEIGRALSGIETVFHCAGMLAPGSTEDYQNTNVKATVALAEAAADAGVKNLIYVSSLSVYGDPPAGNGYIDEKAGHDPRAQDRGIYTQTKVEAEKLLFNFVADQNGDHDALRMVILRPGTIYGPGAKLPVGRFTLPSPTSRPLVTGGRRVPMPLVYVDHVIDAMLAAARAHAPSGTVYNLVDSPELDQGTVAKALREVSGGRIRPVLVPYGVVWTLMLVIDVVALFRQGRLGTARFRLKRTVANMKCGCSAAKKDLGWESRVSLKEGMARTVSALSDAPFTQ